MWETTTVSYSDWHNIVFTDDGRHGRQRRRREGPDRRAAPGTNGNSRQHLGIGHGGKIASMSSIGRCPVGQRRRTVSDNSSGGFLGRDESVEVRRHRETVEEGASVLVKLTPRIRILVLLVQVVHFCHRTHRRSRRRPGRSYGVLPGVMLAPHAAVAAESGAAITSKMRRRQTT